MQFFFISRSIKKLLFASDAQRQKIINYTVGKFFRHPRKNWSVFFYETPQFSLVIDYDCNINVSECTAAQWYSIRVCCLATVMMRTERKKSTCMRARRRSVLLPSAAKIGKILQFLPILCLYDLLEASIWSARSSRNSLGEKNIWRCISARCPKWDGFFDDVDMQYKRRGIYLSVFRNLRINACIHVWLRPNKTMTSKYYNWYLY